MKKVIIAVVALCALATPSHAAKIWAEKADNGKGFVIHLQGVIVKSDANNFTKVVKENKIGPKEAIVYLDSGGGDTGSSIPIGKMIKRMGWNTYVEENRTCMSACAMIWVPGTKRYMTPNSRIGFHSTSFWTNLKKRNDAGNETVMAYYRELGIPPYIGRVFLAADPTRYIMLTPDLAASLNIDVAYSILPTKTKTDPDPAAAKAVTTIKIFPDKLIKELDKEKETK